MCELRLSPGLTAVLRALAVAIGCLLVGGLLLTARDPELPFLVDTGDGVWITADVPVALKSSLSTGSECSFQHCFHLGRHRSDLALELRALRNSRVILDGTLIAETSGPVRRPMRVILPSLDTGDHVLTVDVSNPDGPAAVAVDSDLESLCTGEHWECSLDNGRTWTAARPASDTQWAALSGRFPTAPRAFLLTLPISLLAFVAAFTLTRRHYGRGTFGVRHLKRCAMLVAAAVAVHNSWNLQPYVGYDVLGHLEYIRYVAESGSLPLATDGWQMFQSPLYYLVSAPLYAALADRMEPEAIVRVLRLLPMACSLLQIEIIYRIALLAFPDRPQMQGVAVIAGGLMPMSLSVSQSIGNEPLAGLLSALALLLMFRILAAQNPPTRSYLGLGLVWGLALLTKVSALLLGPVLLTACLVPSPRSVPLQTVAIRFSAVVLGASTVCGWYYVRNWICLGAPFLGGWDSDRGIVWWQYPGYRTIEHFTQFGAALLQPVYSGVHGLWDGLYSTAFADGFLSGIVSYEMRPTWNMPFLIAGAWWGLVPALLIACGVYRSGLIPLHRASQRHPFVLVTAVVLWGYLAALILMYFRVPAYGAAKASYMLGLLPCFGLLAAAGAEPIFRSRTGTAILAGLLASWSTGSLIAFLA